VATPALGGPAVTASFGLPEPSGMLVGRIYFRIAADETTSPTLVGTTGSSLGSANIAVNDRVLSAWFFENASQTIRGFATGPTIVYDAWYRLDWRIDTSGTTWTIEWQVDGAAQPVSAWSSGQPEEMQGVDVGAGGGGFKILDVTLDDLALSTTAADYPLGAGSTVALLPARALTHELAAPPAETFFSSSDGAQTRTPIEAGDAESWSLLGDWPVTTGGSADLVGVESEPEQLSMTPEGQGTIGGWRTDTGASTGLAARVADFAAGGHDGDSSFIQGGNKMTGDAVLLTLADPPAGLDVDRIVRVGLRSAYRKHVSGQAGGPDTIGLNFRVVAADGTTALTSTVNKSGIGTSYAENNDTLSIQGTPTRADWTGAQLRITQSYSSTGQQDAFVQGRVTAVLLVLEVATATGNAYLEHAFAESVEVGQPIAVNVIHALRAAPGSGGGRIGAKVSDDGATFVDLYTEESLPQALAYAISLLSAKPSGGPWTTSSLNSVVQRWGFTKNAKPALLLDAAMLEVAYR
jgi:hypothetical protein